MKNKILFSILAVLVTILSYTMVDAVEISKNDIPSSSYVIGEHLFTRNTNDYYDGKLTTKLIMLAAKTIPGNSLDDMVIYYKTASGKIIDGLSGQAIDNVDSFEIKYKDTQLIVEKPVLTETGTETEPDKKSIVYTVTNIELSDGIEIYKSTDGNDYPASEIRVLTKDNLANNENKIALSAITGEHNYYKIRAYKLVNNTKIYSEYSSIMEVKGPDLIYGDVNGDGQVDPKDTKAIRNYLYGSETEKISKINADVNKDGEIDDVDVILIRKYIAGGYAISLPYDSGAKYKITYELNDGINSSDNIKTYAAISLPFKLEQPTKEGYIFLGWTGSNGNTPQKEVTIAEGTTGDLTYTANWSLLGDANLDGKVNGHDVTTIMKYVGGQSIEISKINADVNQDGEIDDVDADIVFAYVGNWKISLPYDSGAKYKITYDLDGGTMEYGRKTYAEISPLVNSTIKLNQPTREGYVFLGWTGSNGDTPQKEVTIAKGTTGDLTYTANWSLLGDVNLDGIVNSTDVSLLRRYINGSYDEDKDGKISKINADANQDNEIDDVDVILIRKHISEGVELPYDSGAKYKITYDLNDGTNSSDNIRTYAAISLPFKLEQPTKDGCLFLGWTGSNGNTPQKEVTIAEGTTGDLTYTANWAEKPKYTVTFDSNGGSDVESQTVRQGDKVTQPSNPTKEGYTFVSWMLNETEYDFTTPVEGNVTLTAKWVQKTYTIKATMVDSYSPDRILSVYEDGVKISVKEIKSSDGVVLCSESNMTVNYGEIEGITSYLVVLNGGTEVTATLS